MRTPKGIKYVSMYGLIGYFFSAKDQILAFHNRNIPVTWQPVVPDHRCTGGFRKLSEEHTEDPELYRFLNRDIEYDTVIVHTQPELYPYWLEKEAGKNILGYTTWETQRIPPGWKELMNRMPRIIVPSRWNKQIFEKCGVTTPISVVPHIFKPDEKVFPVDVPDIPGHHYVFYSIEEWRARKGIRKTIKSYLNTFTGDDPVTLLLKTSPDIYFHFKYRRLLWLRRIYRNFRKLLKIPKQITIRPNTEKHIASLKKEYSNPPEIKLITRRFSDSEVAGIHSRGNCYVSLCASEGWGLGPFNAAGYGNPVIITGYGGPLDYLPKGDSFHVDYSLVPVRDDEDISRFTPDQLWADPDLTHASIRMREAFENQKKSAEKGERLRKFIRDKFNPEAVTDLYLREIGKALD